LQPQRVVQIPQSHYRSSMFVLHCCSLARHPHVVRSVRRVEGQLEEAVEREGKLEAGTELRMVLDLEAEDRTW
jgi:hypothetical protein